MTGFHCRTCGEFHSELPLCLGLDAPAFWYSIPEQERSTRTLLSSDQCIIDDEHFFVRGRIIIPINGTSDSFIWLVWVSLSKQSFVRASELWETEGRESEPPYFGWLQSALPYDVSTLSLKTNVHTMPLGERPLIEVEPSSHQLALEQASGISIERVQEIVERAFHG